MKKIILHGGGTSDGGIDNAKFFEEMVQSVKDSGVILCVYFSRNSDDWDRLFQDDRTRFTDASHDKIIELEMADFDRFENQIAKANLVYFRGGDMGLLTRAIERYPDFVKNIRGKVLAGSSAGAYLFSTCYYTPSKDQVKQGLGIVPVNVAAHYEGDPSVIEKLRVCGNELENVLLREGEFRTIEM